MKSRSEKWLEYLHYHRKTEIDIIFKKCKPDLFGSMLELGAGDGFQSILLKQFTKFLLCTDYNYSILKRGNLENVEYRILDVENISKEIPGKSFDCIFSSNLLEHVPNISAALNGIHQTLKDDGIAIHVLPSVFWKVCQIILYYPFLLRLLIIAITEKNGFSNLKQKYRNESSVESDESYIQNNPKSNKNKKLIHFLIPQIHGVSISNLEEIFNFRYNYWLNKFTSAGFELIQFKKGNAFSGYGFGFKFLQNISEKLGFSSDSIFIMKKKGSKSAHEQYFIDS